MQTPLHRAFPRVLLPALFTLCLSSGALAQESRPDPLERLSVKLFGGLTTLSSERLQLEEGATSVDEDASFDSGFLTGAAVAWRLDRNWSLEGEFVYRTNELDAFDAPGAQADGGDFSSTTVALNAVYHFEPFESAPRLRPYAGLGLAFLQEIDIDFEGPDFVGEVSYSDAGFALQALAGLEWELGSRVSLFAEARYLESESLELEGEGAASGTVEADYSTFGLLAGVRIGL